jgi:hypothetical protein
MGLAVCGLLKSGAAPRLRPPRFNCRRRKQQIICFGLLVARLGRARTQHAPNRPNYVIFLLRRFFFWTSNCFDLLTYKANEKNKTRPANRLVVDLLLQFAH